MMAFWYKKPQIVRQCVKELIADLQQNPNNWKQGSYTLVNKKNKIQIWITNEPYADCDFYKPELTLHVFERVLIRKEIHKLIENQISSKFKKK